MPTAATKDAILDAKDLKQEGVQNEFKGVTLRLPLKAEGLDRGCVQDPTLPDACVNSDDDNGEELSESSDCSFHDGFCARNEDNNKQGIYHRH
jgi:hypothetical protein